MNKKMKLIVKEELWTITFNSDRFTDDMKVRIDEAWSTNPKNKIGFKGSARNKFVEYIHSKYPNYIFENDYYCLKSEETK